MHIYFECTHWMYIVCEYMQHNTSDTPFFLSSIPSSFSFFSLMHSPPHSHQLLSFLSTNSPFPLHVPSPFPFPPFYHFPPALLIAVTSSSVSNNELRLLTLVGGESGVTGSGEKRHVCIMSVYVYTCACVIAHVHV